MVWSSFLKEYIKNSSHQIDLKKIDCIIANHSKYFSDKHSSFIPDTLHIQRIAYGVALPDRIYLGMAAA